MVISTYHQCLGSNGATKIPQPKMVVPAECSQGRTDHARELDAWGPTSCHHVPLCGAKNWVTRRPALLKWPIRSLFRVIRGGHLKSSVQYIKIRHKYLRSGLRCRTSQKTALFQNDIVPLKCGKSGLIGETQINPSQPLPTGSRQPATPGLPSFVSPFIPYRTSALQRRCRSIVSYT